MLNLSCTECKAKIEPVALLFGTTPGWSCGCQWGSLTKQAYKIMFGRSFKRVHLPNVITGGVYNGNARQRRAQKRIVLRTLRKESAA